jgi:hypothetical protein
VALAAYVLLRQETVHGLDWRCLVLWLEEPGVVHPQHPGYLPIARGLRWLLQPLGLDAYRVLCAFSALGAALAVAGVHRASMALLGDRTFARTAAFLVMWTPALFHFGTVAELHAPFAGVMALAIASAVRQARSGSPGLAVCTGALTGAATLMHATGHLLVPGIGVAVWWASRARGFWRCLNGALLFATTHALLWAGVFAGMRMIGHLPAPVVGFTGAADDPTGLDNPLAYLAGWWRDVDLIGQLSPTVLVEWLLPYAPFSLLVFVAFRVRSLRIWAAGFSVALCVYLLVTVTLVHAITDERGAYLLPLVVPAVWLSLLAVPRRAWPWLAVLTVISGFAFRGEPGRQPPDRPFGRAAMTMAKSHPTTFFVGDFPEMDGILVQDAHLSLLVARVEYYKLLAAQQGDAAFDPTAEQVAAWLQLLALQERQKGSWFVITERAVQFLSAHLPAFTAAWPVFVQQAHPVPLPADAGIVGFVCR